MGIEPTPSAWKAEALPLCNGRMYYEPPVRIELTTSRLQGEYSTTELRGLSIIRASNFEDWAIYYLKPLKRLQRN